MCVSELSLSIRIGILSVCFRRGGGRMIRRVDFKVFMESDILFSRMGLSYFCQGLMLRTINSTSLVSYRSEFLGGSQEF